MILKLCGIDTGWDTFAFEARAFTYKVQQLSLSRTRQGKSSCLHFFRIKELSFALDVYSRPF